MYGLNAVALVFFCCINVTAYQLCKCPKDKRRNVVRCLCAVLLFGNLLRYFVIYPFVKGVVMLPVEFSTVAYFLVPAILLASKKRLHSWAAYSQSKDLKNLQHHGIANPAEIGRSQPDFCKNADASSAFSSGKFRCIHLSAQRNKRVVHQKALNSSSIAP